MNDGTNINGIENGRATFALKQAKNAYAENLDKYDSYVKKIPMMIKTNGLGATLAFMFSKTGKKEGNTYIPIGKSFVDWLNKDNKVSLYGLNKLNNFEDLTKQVVQINSYDYRALTIETLAFLNWLRRFAEGFYSNKKNQST